MRLSCVLLLIGLLNVGVAAADERPNVIIIFADDMGYAGLSCYGNPYFKTPHLDQLAAEGMKFSDFHSSGAVCSPTRAGLMKQPGRLFFLVPKTAEATPET